MFVTSNINVGVSQRVVATLVACATVLFSIGVYHTAQAANYSSVSNTLSDSTPNVTAAHTIAFTVPTASSIGSGDTITITFPTDTNEFSGVDAVVEANVTVTVDGSPASPTGTFGADAGTADTISFSGITAAGDEQVVVAIADGVITNPNPGVDSQSYRIDISNGTDSASTMVAIVDPVTVTASVDTLFTFLISGVATSTTINGETTTGATATTSIDFGEISAGSKYVLGQQLSVSTNAIQGFNVTVENDGNLRSANGADIDTFVDGADTTTATSWTGPTPNVGSEETYGHWGMTYDDTTLDGGVVLSPGEYIAASTTPRQVFYHNGPADGTQTGTGTARVAYAVEISGLQEAADDYTSILTYIATPTF